MQRQGTAQYTQVRGWEGRNTSGERVQIEGVWGGNEGTEVGEQFIFGKWLWKTYMKSHYLVTPFKTITENAKEDIP